MIQIFKAWSRTEKGKIFSQDIEKMSGKLGLPLNKTEADILLSAITKGKKEFIAGSDFCELLYDDKFFDFLDQHDFQSLKTSPDNIRSFIKNRAQEFDVNEKQLQIDHVIIERIRKDFKNNVSGNQIRLNLEDFTNYARKGVPEWSEIAQEKILGIFKEYQKDEMINLKDFYESKEGKYVNLEQEDQKQLACFDTPMEREFYKRKFKRENSINDYENMFGKITRVT